MKCPKCGYTSFDYSQPCPKCNRDISEERKKMNLPSYKPTPFFLLDTLIGEGGKDLRPQGIGFRAHRDIGKKPVPGLEASESGALPDLKLEDMDVHQDIEPAFSPEQEEINLDSADETEELEVTLDDFIFDDSDEDFSEGEDETEELLIEPYLSSDESEISGEYGMDDESSALDLDDISFGEEDEEFDDIDGDGFDKAFTELELASSLDEEALDFSSEPSPTDDDDSDIDLDSIDLDLDLDFEGLDEDSLEK